MISSQWKFAALAVAAATATPTIRPATAMVTEATTRSTQLQSQNPSRLMKLNSTTGIPITALPLLLVSSKSTGPPNVTLKVAAGTQRVCSSRTPAATATCNGLSPTTTKTKMEASVSENSSHSSMMSTLVPSHGLKRRKRMFSQLQMRMTMFSQLQTRMTTSNQLQTRMTTSSQLQTRMTTSSQLQTRMTTSSQLQTRMTMCSQLQMKMTMTSQLQ